MSEKLDITLEDVETAIKVLNIFMRRQRQALATLTRLGATGGRGGGYGMRMEDIWQMAMEQAMTKKGIPTEAQIEPAPEPTEDELKRMRDITEKLKKGEIKSSQRKGY